MRSPKLTLRRALAALAALAIVSLAAVRAGAEGGPTGNATPKPSPPASEERPAVEIIFVLDTTGSMCGIMSTVRSSVKELAQRLSRENAGAVRFGLVLYRDRDEKYVTRLLPLTASLEALREELDRATASGGGDEPEHVSRALTEAVREMRWAERPAPVREIFLIGDNRPQEKYDDGFDWRLAAEEAARRGIRIHALQYLENVQTEKVWREIARRSGGLYRRIAPDTRAAARGESSFRRALREALESTTSHRE